MNAAITLTILAFLGIVYVAIARRAGLSHPAQVVLALLFGLAGLIYALAQVGWL